MIPSVDSAMSDSSLELFFSEYEMKKTVNTKIRHYYTYIQDCCIMFTETNWVRHA